MKKARIYCEIEKTDHYGKDNHMFYVSVGSQSYFLFEQEYRKGVQDYFGNGVELDRALKHGWHKLDRAVMRTIDKLPSYIRYIEKEYDIAILEKTKRRLYA